MKHRWHRLALTALSLFFAFAASAGMSGIPDRVYFKHNPGGPPLWVSLEQAVDAQGRLRGEVLGEQALDRLGRQRADLERYRQRQLARPGSAHSSRPVIFKAPPGAEEVPCEVFSSLNEETGWQPRSSLSDLVEQSVLVVRGEVAGWEQGLYQGVAASLLELAPFEVLSSSGEYSLDSLFVLYPHAAFMVQGFAYCTHNPAYPSLPQVGDHLLLFLYEPSIDTAGQLANPLPFGVVVERSDGSLVLPEEVRDDPRLTEASTLVEVADEVLAELRKGETSQ